MLISSIKVYRIFIELLAFITEVSFHMDAPPLPKLSMNRYMLFERLSSVSSPVIAVGIRNVIKQYVMRNTIVFLITYCFITFLIPTAMTGLLTDDSLSNNMYLFMLNFGKGGASM